jgi:hypothetical protein
MDFDALVQELAAEFKRRGMDTHVALLRRYWRTWHTPVDPDTWTAHEVIGWMWQLELLPGQAHATGLAAGANA